MDLLTKPVAWIVVSILAILGTAFSLPTYFIGQQGMPAVRERFPQVQPERWRQLEDLFGRWGSILLLLTAIPGFGTVIPPAAGANNIMLVPFLIWVTIAKLLRYWFLALVVFGSARAFQNWLNS